MVRKVMVQLNDVAKIFNKDNKVEDISFQIEKGECVALCGGNGSGKSTIIQMIIGNYKPTKGKILIDGVELTKNPMQYKSLFSFMPDQMVFPKVLTGKEVLLFFASLIDAPKNRVDELLEKVGLQHEGNKKVGNYSKGMQQRLAFAQCLLPNAPFIILDEPTNGLDPFWVYQFKEIIKEEIEKGTTILFSSHLLADVEEIADKVILMNKGKILEIGSVEELCTVNGSRVSLEKVFFNKIVQSASK